MLVLLRVQLARPGLTRIGSVSSKKDERINATLAFRMVVLSSGKQRFICFSD